MPRPARARSARPRRPRAFRSRAHRLLLRAARRRRRPTSSSRRPSRPAPRTRTTSSPSNPRRARERRHPSRPSASVGRARPISRALPARPPTVRESSPNPRRRGPSALQCRLCRSRCGAPPAYLCSGSRRPSPSRPRRRRRPPSCLPRCSQPRLRPGLSSPSRPRRRLRGQHPPRPRQGDSTATRERAPLPNRRRPTSARSSRPRLHRCPQRRRPRRRPHPHPHPPLRRPLRAHLRPRPRSLPSSWPTSQSCRTTRTAS